ncbi:MAG TPA: right-handed parallel beta-helix repeat-containing protein [Phycisphaerales bacterium]|nr:right-handed parallel beta-helix repeat-containing protein [Phycisphaerales bacterium]
MLTFALVACLSPALASQTAVDAPAGTPVLEVTSDNTEVTRSCVVRIAPGAIIEDTDGNGVLHVKADGVTVEFEKGAVLRGAKIDNNWNELKGVGIRIDGHKNVSVKNAEIAGFKVGLHATRADGLTLDRLNVHDCYRQRLKSTPQKEHNDDWMFPHNNDGREWMTQHGGAVVVERSRECTLSNITVRATQNGIILDRVTGSKVFDNDCSFLSGWGLAMWRSSENTVARNAFDFCVRGHSEGVYNRGQDSAGILMFEQCSSNVIAENSVTHGGDGLFGFAGRVALGEAAHNPEDGAFDPTSAGCNDNTILGNDFSYAPAHGLEMTFSSGNLILGNRFVENAICGIWGGYSRNMIIARNTFEGNGGMAYGLERGAINIEHGSDNTIAENTFTNNRCAFHLWWDDDGALLEKPLVKANDKGVSNNIIANNTITINDDHPFTRDKDKDRPLVVLHLRDVPPKGQPAPATPHLKDNIYAGNTVTLTAKNAKEIDADAGSEPLTLTTMPDLHIPQIKLKLPGVRTPVGARHHLRGRANIVMTEWGPWEHVGKDPRVSP